MQETYYITQEGITTINYAYMQDDVIVYPDLIKVKVALDNGDILGIETTGYLNNHTKEIFRNVQITSEEAKKNLNSKLELKVKEWQSFQQNGRQKYYVMNLKEKLMIKNF